MKRRLPEIAAGLVGGAVVAALAVAAFIRDFEKRLDRVSDDDDEWYAANRRAEWGDA